MCVLRFCQQYVYSGMSGGQNVCCFLYVCLFVYLSLSLFLSFAIGYIWRWMCSVCLNGNFL